MDNDNKYYTTEIVIWLFNDVWKLHFIHQIITLFPAYVLFYSTDIDKYFYLIKYNMLIVYLKQILIYILPLVDLKKNNNGEGRKRN